jgi:hypothetical protein
MSLSQSSVTCSGVVTRLRGVVSDFVDYILDDLNSEQCPSVQGVIYEWRALLFIKCRLSAASELLVPQHANLHTDQQS